MAAKDFPGRAVLMRCLADPLFHFACLGAAAYCLTSVFFGAVDTGARDNRIEIGPERMAALAAAWQSQRGAVPTAVEMQNLIDEEVEEEIYYREAIRLGLDQDDTIVRRRLAQKMRFLIEDTMQLGEPSEDELRAYYEASKASYTRPGRTSFRHIYFSPSSRQAPDQDAADALIAVSGNADVAASVGDPSLVASTFHSAEDAKIGATFGDAFLAALADQPVGQWSGPVSSAFGEHLVFVEARIPSSVRQYEEVAEQVRAEMMESLRRRHAQDLGQEMRSRYTIVVPGAEARAK